MRVKWDSNETQMKLKCKWIWTTPNFTRLVLDKPIPKRKGKKITRDLEGKWTTLCNQTETYFFGGKWKDLKSSEILSRLFFVMCFCHVMIGGYDVVVGPTSADQFSKVVLCLIGSNSFLWNDLPNIQCLCGNIQTKDRIKYGD